MKSLPHISLIAAAVALVIAVILSIGDWVVIATANGWLDLALVLAVFSIATKVVCVPKEKS